MFSSKKNQALAWAILTTAALLIPGRPDSDMRRWLPEALEPFADKLVHVLLFFVLLVLTDRAINQETADRGSRDQLTGGRVGLGATLISVGLFVVLLEICQIWVPNRSFEALDIAAGLLGALTAAGMIVAKYR